jgi:tetratricopeptide (TPR) repeat protein
VNAREPKQFVLGVLAGLVVVGAYAFLPNLDDQEAQFRRATIAERFFRPANRLEPLRRKAMAGNDWKTLRRINESEWNIADARAFAPDDFPYLETQTLSPSPIAELKKVMTLQQTGRTIEGERLLQGAKEKYPFGRCEFSTNLAIIYYTSNRKELALQELEGVQSLVDKAASSNCARSQFLLGSLYQELNRSEDARRVFREFMTNTEGATDAETKSYRQKLSGAGL